MEVQAATVLDTKALTAIADPGYYKGKEIVDCYAVGIKALDVIHALLNETTTECSGRDESPRARL